jgi:hypothetical protein
MAGQLNKIHVALRYEKSRQIIGNLQRSKFQIGRHNGIEHENAIASVTGLPQNTPSVAIGRRG